MVRAQNKYKSSYDRKIHNVEFKLGQWVLVRFPQEETGKQQKLARPWHGPYHVVEKRDPDLTVVSVYFPQKGRIQIHQSRVTPCPDNLPAGFYWYGGRLVGPGKPPKWVGKLYQDPDDYIHDVTVVEDADLEETTPECEPVPQHKLQPQEKGRGQSPYTSHGDKLGSSCF